jgi:hypothetical protein
MLEWMPTWFKEPIEAAGLGKQASADDEDGLNTILLGSTEWAPIKRDTLVGRIRTGIDHEVSFDLKLHGSVVDCGSIVHFTATGADSDGYGSRIPGIWTDPGQTTLRVSSGHEGNGNDIRSTRALTIDSEVKVRLRVQGTACTVWFDDEKVLDEPTMMGMRQEHEGVKVYVGDPWYESANGELCNLQYTNLSADALTLEIGGITVESTMTEADFSGNNLEEADVVALAAFLPKCK